jgi:hypothetical protein
MFEIKNRIENNDIKVKIYFSTYYSEEYDIDEITTFGDLFETIITSSKIFSEIPEKRLYWIYIEFLGIDEYVVFYEDKYLKLI